MITGQKRSLITAIKDNEALIYKIAAVYTNSVGDRKDVQLKMAKRKVLTLPMDGQFSAIRETEADGFEEKWAELKQQLDKLNLPDKGIIMLLNNYRHGTG